MAKTVRKKQKSVADRLRIFAPQIDGFRTWLHNNGYRRVTCVELVRLLACWADWIRAAGFTLDTVLAGLDASAAVFKGSRANRAPYGAAALFIRYLQDKGILSPPPKPPSPAETWPILAAFRHWMRSERGLLDTTLDTYQSSLVDFIKSLGDDPSAYDARAVRAFVLAQAAPNSRRRAQPIAVATRAFLRFLIATDQCPVGLDHAIPKFANWQLASIPCHLETTDIDRVIAACNGDERLRDKAIILLLARLGLRASEVSNLTFGQIDWQHGRFTVAGKSRREERLPLTQEIGDAMIAYIERTRPRVPTPQLFLTEVAPIGPLTRITVKCIVRRALDRAGIDSAHRGAHVLRHSAATAMLQHGVSLAGVGAVLRHRSPGMTAHYAKVDIALLSEIAQPWIGRLPC